MTFNARDPGQSATAHAFYPQIAGLKQVTPGCGESRLRRVCTVRPGNPRDGRVKSIVPGSSGATSADEIAMSEENDGILGNLPRSRPGVRSDKRASSKRAGGAGGSAGSPPGPKTRAATTPRTTGAARTRAATKPRRKPTPPPATPPPASSPRSAGNRGADPIGAALKAGETVALTGIKVAGRVAGGVLRRLPRP